MDCAEFRPRKWMELPPLGDGGHFVYDCLFAPITINIALLTEGVLSTSVNGFRLQSTSEIFDTVY